MTSRVTIARAGLLAGGLGGAIALAVLLLLGADTASAQCAMCRDAVASSSSETRAAMNYAIIGLAVTPYGVAALAALALSPGLRAHLRARLKRAARPPRSETR